MEEEEKDSIKELIFILVSCFIIFYVMWNGLFLFADGLHFAFGVEFDAPYFLFKGGYD